MPKKLVPSSEERPDLYDAYDSPAVPWKPSEEYRRNVTPKHVQELIAAKANKHPKK